MGSLKSSDGVEGLPKGLTSKSKTIWRAQEYFRTRIELLSRQT